MSDTPLTGRLLSGWHCIGDVAPQLAALACRLECDRSELIEVLEDLVDYYALSTPRWSKARALLQRIENGK